MSQSGDRRTLFSGLKIVSLCTLLSRVLGLVRDMGMATMFGNGPIMDAFSVAFRIPNFVRRLFGEGALTAAFLPAFVRDIERNGNRSAWRLASAMLTILAVALVAFVLLGECLLWGVSSVWDLSDEGQLLTGLAAVMLPYLVLICLAALVSAMMHALGHFTWPALVPVILNVAWIVGIWGVAHRFSDPIHQVYAVAIAVVVGGILQLIVPLPRLFKLGFRYQKDWYKKTDPALEELDGAGLTVMSKVRAIVNSMLPVLLGLSITQLNSLLDSFIAWGVSQPEIPDPQAFAWPVESGTASALYLGQRLYQFPLGVFGIALGTVLFPLLARHSERNRNDLLCADLSMGIRLVLWVGIPASVGLALLAEPLTQLLFRYGRFDATDARQTAAMIAAYGIGVWAYCGLLILHRGFYAIGDQLSPMYIGMVAMLGNTILNFVLIWFIGGVGLAIGTAFVSSVQVLAVAALLQKRVGNLHNADIRRTAIRTLFATALMSLACYATMQTLPTGSSVAMRLLRVFAPVLVSVAVFFGMSILLRLNEWRELLNRRSA